MAFIVSPSSVVHFHHQFRQLLGHMSHRTTHHQGPFPPSPTPLLRLSSLPVVGRKRCSTSFDSKFPSPSSDLIFPVVLAAPHAYVPVFCCPHSELWTSRLPDPPTQTNNIRDCPVCLLRFWTFPLTATRTLVPIVVRRSPSYLRRDACPSDAATRPSLLICLRTAIDKVSSGPLSTLPWPVYL